MILAQMKINRFFRDNSLSAVSTASLIVIIVLLLAIFLFRSCFEGNLKKGSIAERVLVPSNLRVVLDDLRLEPNIIYYDADSFEGFYKTVYNYNLTSKKEIARFLNSKKNAWKEVSYRSGSWGWSQIYESEYLQIIFIFDTDKTFTVKISNKIK